MPRKKRTPQQKEVQDYRHDTATRKNNPPAGIAAQGKSKKIRIQGSVSLWHTSTLMLRWVDYLRRLRPVSCSLYSTPPHGV